MNEGFPDGAGGKESTCWCRRRGFDPWVRKIPWRRKWQPTPVFLPGESHGRRRLTGNSPWGFKELDTAEYGHMQSRDLTKCPNRDTIVWLRIGTHLPVKACHPLKCLYPTANSRCRCGSGPHVIFLETFLSDSH